MGGQHLDTYKNCYYDDSTLQECLSKKSRIEWNRIVNILKNIYSTGFN